MRITIVGIGAMGSLFAARLSQLADITLLGSWQAQIDTINQQGITLIHPDGRKTQHPIQATNDPTQIPAADLVLIVVKSPKTAAAARSAAQSLNQSGLVISLQNGLGNLETIANIVGPQRAALGTTSEGAAILEPGVVRHGGVGQTYLAKNIGRSFVTGSSRIAQIERTAALFNQAGFSTTLVKDADGLIWGKLAINAGINPLTALLQVPNGFLLQSEAAYWIMSQAATEVAAVAQALQISLPFPEAAVQAQKVAEATAANRSSMAQDVARGVPTEIEAICGAIVHYGKQLDIPTPVNRTLLDLVQQQTATGTWQKGLSDQPTFIQKKFIRISRDLQHVS